MNSGIDFQELIDQIKEEIRQEYRTEDLTDLCDVACEKLKEHNISGKIINSKVKNFQDT